MSFDCDHAMRLLQRVNELNDLRDVVLVAGIDKTKISVHRLIMIATSSYFEALLGPNFLEGSSSSDIILPHIDGATLKLVIDYCYSGRIDINEDNVNNIVFAASSMELIELEKMCCHFWKEHLNTYNCIDIYTNADKYSFDSLKRKSFQTICNEFENVPPDDFLRLDFNNFIELLQCDKIETSEEIVFNQMKLWLENNTIENENKIFDIFKCIRLECFSGEFLSESVEPLFEAFNCSELVTSEYKRRCVAKETVNESQPRYPTLRNVLRADIDELSGQVYIYLSKFDPVERRFISLETEIVFVEPRDGIGLVGFQGKLYFIGGVMDTNSANVFESVDLVTKEREVLPKMDVVRNFVTPVADEKYIYVFGGFNGKTKHYSCERYDIEQRKWNSLSRMNVARYGYAAVKMNGQIYVAGGSGNHHTSLNSVERYDPKTDQWLSVSSMNMPRQDFILVESQGFIYAMGGAESVERYDPHLDMWTVIVLQESNESISAAISIRNEAYVFQKEGYFSKLKIWQSNLSLEQMCSNGPWPFKTYLFIS